MMYNDVAKTNKRRSVFKNQMRWHQSQSDSNTGIISLQMYTISHPIHETPGFHTYTTQFTPIDSSQLGKILLDSTWVGTNDSSKKLTVLEEQKCWHGRNTVRSSNIWQLVNVHLVEVGGSVLLCKVFDHWGEHLTRSTPSGKEVNNDEIGGGDSLLELSFRSNLFDGGHFWINVICR